MKWPIVSLVVMLLALGLMLTLNPCDAIAKKPPPEPPPDPEPEADPAIAYVELYRSRGAWLRRLAVMNADEVMMPLLDERHLKRWGHPAAVPVVPAVPVGAERQRSADGVVIATRGLASYRVGHRLHVDVVANRR